MEGGDSDGLVEGAPDTDGLADTDGLSDATADVVGIFTSSIFPIFSATLRPFFGPFLPSPPLLPFLLAPCLLPGNIDPVEVEAVEGEAEGRSSDGFLDGTPLNFLDCGGVGKRIWSASVLFHCSLDSLLVVFTLPAFCPPMTGMLAPGDVRFSPLAAFPHLLSPPRVEMGTITLEP